MPYHYRYPHACSGNRNIIGMHYLPGLLYQFPFLFGVSVTQKNVYLRQHIKGYLVRINMGHSILPLKYLFCLHS